MKFMGLISLNFDITYQLLIICLAPVKHWVGRGAQQLFVNESISHEDRTPALYSEGPTFKYQQEDQLS
jgi:hypothetical protein